ELTMTSFATKIAPTMLANSGCKETADAQRQCLQTWATGFAERALRRPARADEAALYAKLLGAVDGTANADGSAVEAVVDAVSFSPSFLYRTEVGSVDASQPGVRKLAAPEMATRLSYLATLGPPDGALLGDAASGALADGQARLRHLDRLLATDLG